MVITVINKVSQWIQILDPPQDVIPTLIQFSLVNTPGQVNCISEDSLPHEFFLHLFGEEFLDALIAETNL